MLTIKKTNQFKKDLKRIVKQGYDMKELEYVIEKLANQMKLEERYYDHQLTGELKDFRECHIKPDWLLMYMVKSNELILTLARTCSHSELEL